MIVSELDLLAVLRHIAKAACALVGARYGALGVIGGLVQFIHVGMDDEAVDRIGHLPEGKAPLGAGSTNRSRSGSA